MNGDRRFIGEGGERVDSCLNFSDWDPVHYLDVAEMTTAVAIGYDLAV